MDQDDLLGSEVEVEDYYIRQNSNLGKKIKKNQPEFLQLKTLKAQRTYKLDMLRKQDCNDMLGMAKDLKKLR